jgi:hypothetical protein
MCIKYWFYSSSKHVFFAEKLIIQTKSDKRYCTEKKNLHINQLLRVGMVQILDRKSMDRYTVFR